MCINPFKVEEIFFECLPGLRMHGFISYVWVFFVSAAFVIFTAVVFPICNTTEKSKFNYRIYKYTHGRYF